MLQRIASYDVTSRPLTRNIETHSNNFVDQRHRTRVCQQRYGVHRSRFFCHGVQRSEVLLLQTPPSGVWDAAPLVLALMILMSRRSHINLYDVLCARAHSAYACALM